MLLIEATRNKLDDAVREPILLSKPSRQGEPMYLGVRHIGPPYALLGKYARYRKEGDSLLLIDVYAGEGENLHPVGYKDWMVKANVADEGHNCHTYVQPQNRYEELALKAWGDAFNLNAFYVDQDYQRNGIGTFLVAVSLEFLRSLAINTLGREALTPRSRASWRRFGASWEERSMPFKEVSEHHLIEKTLSYFL